MDLPTPRDSKVHIYRGNLEQHPQFYRAIAAHSFNRRVQLSLYHHSAASATALLEAATFPDQYFYYSAAQVTLRDLIHPDFLKQTVRGGHCLTALASSVRLENHDIFAITSAGKLVLSLTKESYQECGLTGSQSSFKASPSRYHITIDLRADAMKVGTKYYERIHWAFSQVLTQPFTVDIALCNPSTGQSLAMPVPSTWHSVKKHQIQPRLTTQPTITTPTASCIRDTLWTEPGTAAGASEWQNNALALYDWMALAALDASCVQAADIPAGPYSPLDTIPTPNCAGQVHTLEYTGFISPYTVRALMATLVNTYSKSPENQSLTPLPPWAALHVLGMPNAPVSFDTKERASISGGATTYSLLCWPSSVDCLGFFACTELDQFD
ncbi:hypothetical protein H4R34_004632 [Dimargaris verticillata]|uniref:Uncharacterized protein n=1 Tax=Dimargaris verticillata TaxID=2761393 RepID=A0A9W8E7X9_9FUNG|nr:hypothetical protein H4R34_004632 [Dimargaris verticillata]